MTPESQDDDMNHREQEEIDSEGRKPTIPKGTRVVFLPDKDPSKEGLVLLQYLHYDGDETFFGNVIVRMDDGRLMRANGWQCEEVPTKPCTGA